MEGKGILEAPKLSAHVGIDHDATSRIPAHAGGERRRQFGAELIAALRRVTRRLHVEHQPEPGPHVGSKPVPRLAAGEPQLHADLEEREIGLERAGLASGRRRIGARIEDEAVATEIRAGELKMQRSAGGDLVAQTKRRGVARAGARGPTVSTEVADKEYGPRVQQDIAIR